MTTKLTPSLVLKNPIVSAGSPVQGNVKRIKAAADAGFGAICTKTTNRLEPLQRYPRSLYTLMNFRLDPYDPYQFPEDFTFAFKEHNSAFPADKFAKIIENSQSYVHERDCRIIGNIAGRSLNEWEELARMYEAAGCDALELNFCCPMTSDVREMARSPEEAIIGICFSLNPELGTEVVRRLKKAVSIPLFPKISPDAQDVVGFAKRLEEAGADGISLFANNSGLLVDIETGKPVNFGFSNVSGPGTKPFTLRWVAEVARATRFAVLAGRGAVNARDAIEFIMVGAGAVEMSSIVVLRGLSIVKELVSELQTFVERKGYNGIEEMRGIALKHILSGKELVEKTKPLYCELTIEGLRKCTGCGRCMETCWYDAISVPRRGKARIIREKCVGCTLCSQVCPRNAIAVRERESEEEYLRALFAEHPELAPENIK